VLREKLSSPKGTTIAGLLSLDEIIMFEKPSATRLLRVPNVTRSSVKSRFRDGLQCSEEMGQTG